MTSHVAIACKVESKRGSNPSMFDLYFSFYALQLELLATLLGRSQAQWESSPHPQGDALALCIAFQWCKALETALWECLLFSFQLESMMSRLQPRQGILWPIVLHQQLHHFVCQQFRVLLCLFAITNEVALSVWHEWLAMLLQTLFELVHSSQ